MRHLPTNSIHVGSRLRDLDESKVLDLAVSIKLQGLLQPVVVTEAGELVAGLHRLRAVQQLGWDEVPAVVVDDRFARLAEIDENLVRNDLSVLEQGEHLLLRDQELERLGLRAQAGDNQHTGTATVAAPVTTGAIGKQAGLSARTVRERVQIAKRLPESIREAIRGTPLANRTRALVELARVRDQAELPGLVETLIDGAASVLDARRLLRQRERLRQIEALEDAELDAPEGPFGVLVVDPPWDYPGQHRQAAPYAVMSVAEVEALPVGDLADDSAVVWLWATTSTIFDAKGIVEGWGFQVKGVLTWVKTAQPVVAHWMRGRTEFAVLGVRGHPAWSPASVDNVVTAPRPLAAHSRKPDEFYSIAENVCPDPRRVELFARRPRTGWRAWGLEAPSSELAEE